MGFVFLLACVGLLWGLIAPRHIAKIVPGKGEITRKRSSLGFGVVALVSMIIGAAAAPPSVSLKTANTSNSAKTATQSQPQVITKQEQTTDPVPFATVNQNDSTLPKGQTKIIQAGVNGEQTTTYTVTYSDGVETNRQQAGQSVVTKAPVDQIVAVGTYVAPPQPSCTNGTYVNSVGNTVCRPETNSSAPAGATARCGDGTYSFSQSRSGTCSHHGGVAAWL